MLQKFFILLVCIFFSTSLFADYEWIGGKKFTQLTFNKKSNGLNINFSLKGFYLDAKAGKVKADSLENLLEAGNPNLLSKGILIYVPKGQKAVLKNVKTSEYILEDITIAPAKQYFSRCNCQKPLSVINNVVYSKDEFFPKRSIELIDLGIVHGNVLKLLRMYPLRYNPVKRKLKYNEDFNIELAFVGEEKVSSSNSVFSNILSSSVLNFDQENIKKDNIVIVTPREFLLDLNEYINWKRRFLDVNVLIKEDIGSTADAIKSKIQEMYNEKKISYLLLIGDEGYIPYFTRSTAYGNAASDYVYSLLEGEDILPDTLVGRFVISNRTELKNQIDKILNYESNNIVKVGAGIASNQGWNPSDKDYIEQIEKIMIDNGYTFHKFLQREGTATAGNINAAINSGVNWLTYIGHGNGFAWHNTNDTYNNDTISTLENNWKNFFIVDVACKNGQFQYSYESFGERWTTLSEIGAFAYFGGSTNIRWHEPGVMSRGIALKHFGSNLKSLGSSILAGQLYLLEQMGTNSGTIDNLEYYNLFGDASTIIK